MTRSRWLGRLVFVVCATTLLTLEASGQRINDRAAAKAACPPLRKDDSKINDYRLRFSTEFMRFSIEDNWTAHTKPAIDRMKAGDYSRAVLADLDFTLRGWPNHPLALRALIDYEIGGGKFYDFPATECYFAHAQRWFGNDPAVFMLEGQYYWKKRNFEDARLAYLDALAIDDSFPEGHYNLGLVYFELKQMDKAVEHAKQAYSGGYPLPGLRRKLTEAGVWFE